MTGSQQRRDQIAERLAEVERRIAAACAAAGRRRAEVTLIVVTKTYPASDAAILADLGVTDAGENRHPEARDKAAAEPRLRWHFLGGLQTNKAAAVSRYADVVHSVDRARLVEALSRGAQAADRTVDCLVQVDFEAHGPADGPGGRSGIAPEGVAALADAVAEAPGLALRGLMTVAPLGVDPAPHFAHLARLADAVRAAHPGATVVSAGMSGDFEAAIAAGATHLRIGRSVLGERVAPG